jgi:hypothetical protein
MERLLAWAAKGFAAAGLVVLALAPSVAFAQAAANVCGLMAGLSANGLAAGANLGQFGFIGAGQIVTMTATLNTASGGTFRIASNPTTPFTPDLAGPSPIPGTLTYIGTGAVPPGGQGVGYVIDTATGGTVNLVVTCAAIAVPIAAAIPATSPTTLMLMAGLLLALGSAFLYRRRLR